MKQKQMRCNGKDDAFAYCKSCDFGKPHKVEKTCEVSRYCYTVGHDVACEEVA